MSLPKGVATLVGARDGYFILYPQYFDNRISRGQGRRVSRDMAVKSPTSLDVFHAFWFNQSGRVLISVDNVDGTKAGLINVIARYMKQG